MPAGKKPPKYKTTKDGIILKRDMGYGGNTPGYIPDQIRNKDFTYSGNKPKKKK